MAIRLHTWTEEENLIIRREYNHTRGSRSRLAKRFRITEPTLRAQLARMGLCYIKRAWTAAEEAQLQKLVNNHPPLHIARLLHRSVSSVVHKSRKLGLGFALTKRDGWLTAKDVAYIVGVDPAWVKRRIDSGVLRAKPYDETNPPQQGCWHPWCITTEDFRDFIIKYPEELDGHNVDFTSLVEILVTPSKP